MKQTFLAYVAITGFFIFFGRHQIYACDTAFDVENSSLSNNKECREHQRMKRATDSNLRRASNSIGPYARLANGISLHSHLFNPKTKLSDIIAELLNMEHWMLDSLLSFDDKPLIQKFQSFMSIDETDLDPFAADFKELDRFRQEFEAMDTGDPHKRFDQYVVIRSLTTLDSYDPELANRCSKMLDEFLLENERTDWTQIDVRKEMSSKAAKLEAELPNLADYLKTISSFDSSPFDPIAKLAESYLNFLNSNLPTLFDTKKMKNIGNLLEHSDHFKKALETLGVVKYLMRIAENKMDTIVNRQFTGAFLSGAADLMKLKSDLNGSTFEKLMIKENIPRLAKALDPIFDFGKNVSTLGSAILEYAKKTNLRSKANKLLNLLSTIIKAGSSDEYQLSLKSIDDVRLDLQSPESNQDVKEFLKVYQMIDNPIPNPLLKVANISKELEEMTQAYRDIKSKTDHDEFKNGAQYNNAVKAVNMVKNMLEALKQVPSDDPLKNFMKTVKRVESQMKEAVSNVANKIRSTMDNSPVFHNVIKMVKDTIRSTKSRSLETPLEPINGLLSILKSQMTDIQKNVTSFQKSEMNDISRSLSNWKREQINGKLVAGFVLLDAFGKVLDRKTDIQLLVKSGRKLSEKIYEFVKETDLRRISREKLGNMYYIGEHLMQMITEIETFERSGSVSPDDFVRLESLIEMTDEIKNPGMAISDWIDVIEMLEGSPVNRKLMADTSIVLAKNTDLLLDFSAHRRQISPNAKAFMELELYLDLLFAKPIRPEKLSSPVPFYRTELFLFVSHIVLFAIIIFALLFYFCSVIVPEETIMMSDMYAIYFKGETDVRKRPEYANGKIMPPFSVYPERKEYRRRFHQFLLDEREKYKSSFEMTIRKLAETIQQEYIARRGKKKADEERGTYHIGGVDDVETPSGRIWYIRQNKMHSSVIWGELSDNGVTALIDLNNKWCEDYQTELCLEIKEHGKVLYSDTPLPQPVPQLELHLVERTKNLHKMAYWKYENMPYGFAPFELTPTQTLYEVTAGTDDGNENFESIAVMDRDGCSTPCIFPLIDTLMYIMSTGNSLNDLKSAGRWMANERTCSIDLVTTAQIEFALYVCFKILDEESPEKTAMFNAHKSMFVKDLQDAWASSWLKNYAKFQKYYESQDLTNLPENDRDVHWYKCTKPKMHELRQKVATFLDVRQEYDKTYAHLANPNKKKKEEKSGEKKKIGKKNHPINEKKQKNVGEKKYMKLE